MAIGDDVGTTHVYELPRTLCRPVVNEEKIMRAFLTRSGLVSNTLSRYPKSLDLIRRTYSVPLLPQMLTMAPMRTKERERKRVVKALLAQQPLLPPAPAPAADAVGVGFGDEEDDNPQETAAAKAAAAKAAAREQAKKEEEEFLKMEEAFIAELGLSLEEVPEGLRGSWKEPQ